MSKRIYERNPDTGEIRSRKPGDYGNERIEYPSQDDIIAFNRKENALKDNELREDILSDIWSANKNVKDGHWYVRLTDIIKIVTG